MVRVLLKEEAPPRRSSAKPTKGNNNNYASNDPDTASNDPGPGKKALEPSNVTATNTTTNAETGSKNADVTAKSQDKSVMEPPNAGLNTPASQRKPSNNKGREAGGKPAVGLLPHHAIQHGPIPEHNMYNYQRCQEAYHWNAWNFFWQQSYRALVEYKQIRGNVDVPPNYTHPVAGNLSGWIASQRVLYHQKDLSMKRIEQLLDLGVDLYRPVSSTMPFPTAITATNNYQIISTEKTLGVKQFRGPDRDKEKRRRSCRLCKEKNHPQMYLCSGKGAGRGRCEYFDLDGKLKKRELVDKDIMNEDPPNLKKSVQPIETHDQVSVGTPTNNNQSNPTLNTAGAESTNQRREVRSGHEKKRSRSSKLCNEKNSNDDFGKEKNKTKKRSLPGDKKTNESIRRHFGIDRPPSLNSLSIANHTTTAPSDSAKPAQKRYRGKRGKDKEMRRRACGLCKEYNGKNLYDCRGKGGKLWCDYYDFSGKEKTSKGDSVYHKT